MRVLFWGTSAFATPSLEALLGEGFDVVAVVTQPDRPRGRSRSTLTAPPVKEAALEEGIPVLQPERPRGADFLACLLEAEPDLSVVAAYGQILPREVIDFPARGTINVHASLLPALRGAAPIQAAIRQGLTETGVTIMRVVPALDAGPIIFQQSTPVVEDETFGELELRLSELGALALVEALTLMELGGARELPQDDALATYAPKVEREMTRIDWGAAADDVARQIRAYDPRPGAFTTLRGSEVKLFGAVVTSEADTPAGGQAGDVMAIDGRGMLVRCGERAVRIAAAHPAGRRRVGVEEWARGRAIQPGDHFGG